jgi:hypothetical protein
MADDIFLIIMNGHAVFTAVYSDIPLFFTVIARCFSLLFFSGDWPKPSKSAAQAGFPLYFFRNNSE